MRKILVSIILALGIGLAPIGSAVAVEGDAGHSPNVVTYQEYLNAEYTMPMYKVHQIFDLKPTVCLLTDHRKNCYYPSKNGPYGVYLEYLYYNSRWRVSYKCWNC